MPGKKLLVGTMANSVGLPLQRAEQAGYFKDAGLTVEVVVFATGAPINEAMAAEELDLAVSGMASVYALATGRYKYIGEGCITIEGQTMFARKDSPVALSKGVIAGTFGSAATVKGASILGPLATSAHYLAIKYAESFGLSTDDFQMVSMEFPQSYQAFVTGKGDLISTTPPYSMQLEDAGYVKVCDLTQVLGSPLVDANYAQNKVWKERRGDLLAFLDCYYRACKDLNDNPGMRKGIAKKWYAEEGKRYSDADLDSEAKRQTYPTLDMLLTPKFPFAFTMIAIGEFFAGQGMIAKENLPNIKASLDSSLVEELKAKQ
ncbi:MAG: ABC transporter substrate-binding protein [Planctomycetota bacterium]|jgi:ABC-type nitrate/sulfonate/bicarbonate transport system substrate-binding protein|nr:ABC transporter substrate-binding protein [Planctomycetota bacterium]